MATVALVMRSESRHRALYLEALRDLPSVSEVVIADPEGGTFDEARQTVHNKPMRTYTSLDAMLQAESPAMAIVTASGAESPGLIRPLLEAGVPVMAEKPACVDPDGFAALVELAERKHVELMLALANRINPWVEDARRIVRSQGIGKLYAVRGLRLADQTRIWSPGRRDWTFRRAEAGGGHLIWCGIHWLDLVLFITGDRIVEVQAMTPNVGGAPIDVEDLALVNFQFASGAHGSLVSGYLLDAGYQLDLTCWGSDGWVCWGAGDRFDLKWHGRQAGPDERFDRRFEYSSPWCDYTPWVRETLRASLGEIDPPITGGEGLAVLRVIFAAYEAARTGRTVKL